MNTFIIKNKGRAVQIFKGEKLSNCIIKLGNGRIKWEKYEIYQTIAGALLYIKGTKPCQSEPYFYTIHRVPNFLGILDLVKQEKDMVKPMLASMVKTAFDIFFAGTQAKEVKDRKYRMVKKLKQMSLFPMLQQSEMAHNSKVAREICYK